MVERLLCKQEVRGSIPRVSTTGQRPFPLSGRGLCHARTPAKYGNGVHRTPSPNWLPSLSASLIDAEDASDRLLRLPFYTGLSEAEQDEVIEAVEAL